MKFNSAVSASRRKSRKAHFQAHSTLKAKIMSASLSKELREKYNVRAVPIRKGDEILVVRGTYKNREGQVNQVYRKKYVVHVDRVTKDKVNGSSVPVGLKPSNVVITKLHLDNDRKKLLERKNRAKDGAEKAKKYTEAAAGADLD
jgi:large subunit ribosomal protein L26e